MSNTIKTNKVPAPTIIVDVIPLKGDFAQAFDPESFLEWHNYAVGQSNGDLKPLTLGEAQEADYVVIAKDENGKKKGQCLLFNAAAGVDRVQPYLGYLNDPQESIILTSLSGAKAVPAMLDAVQTSPNLAGKHICAKTKASNDYAQTEFNAAGFITKGPDKAPGDDYESYHYHADNTALPATPDIAVPKSPATPMHMGL